VLLVVLGADLGTCQLLLQGFCLRGCAILVCAAEKERVDATRAAVLGEDVCAQAAADQVAQMGNVVDVGQSGCDENVLGVFFRHNRMGRRADLI